MNQESHDISQIELEVNKATLQAMITRIDKMESHNQAENISVGTATDFNHCLDVIRNAHREYEAHFPKTILLSGRHELAGKVSTSFLDLGIKAQTIINIVNKLNQVE